MVLRDPLHLLPDADDDADPDAGCCRKAILRQGGTDHHFGVKHLHQYVYRQSFTIISDHGLLMHILSLSKATQLG